MTPRTLSARRPLDATDRARAEAVEAFGREAPPAAQMIYFSGSCLAQGDPAVRAAKRLIDLGVAIPTQRRIGPGLFDYYLTKRRAVERQVVSRASVESRRGGAANDLAEECDLLMAVLRRCASNGEACPTNGDLARRAWLKDGEAARYRLQRLQQSGRIDIMTTAAGVRVVTIVASGRSTARVAGCPGDSRGRRS